MNSVHMGRGGDLNAVLKSMFGIRGESRRIAKAETLGGPAYDALGLGAEFRRAIAVLRRCLEIRNQYSHWMMWDDNSGKLAFASIEQLAKKKGPVTDLRKLRVFHVDVGLLAEQEAYFAYSDRYLAWINYEGRYLSGALSKRIQKRPRRAKRPRLRLR
jgi:DNA-directed RNA polymerase subunit K/omega